MMNGSELKKSVIQFVKFNLVGLLNTLVDFLVYTLLTEGLGLVYLAAKAISYSCGVLNSFFFNSRWTFKDPGRAGLAKRFLPFVAVNLISLGVSLGCMYLLRNVAMLQSDFWCNIIATPIALVVNFLGNKLFVFRNQ